MLRGMSRRLSVPLVLVAIALAAAGCPPPEERVPVVFQLPPPEPVPGQRFLDTPWPSDLMTLAGGLDLSTFPNPDSSGALEDIIRLIQTNPGYSATGTLYFRVDGGIDETSLPASPAASLEDDAALFLVEAATLRRVPVEWKHYAEGTSYLPPGTVAVQPLLGAVPRGRFALVVTSEARAAGGLSLGPSEDLLALMTCAPQRTGTRTVDCAPYRDLVEGLGVAPDSVALVQMVTPFDAVGGMVRAAEVVRALPSPTYAVSGPREARQGDDTIVYDGVVSLAQLQKGSPPYDVLDFESGGFVFDGDGLPVVQRFEEVPFVLTVPRTPPPPGGYCVMINGHGTGGDLESGLGNDARAEAWQVAQAGCAMLAVSEPLHRTRSGYRAGQEELLTFNFFNPLAGRDNWRQSAVEKVQLVSLAEALVVPASVSGGAELRFDRSRISYFGHSQGGITGALFVAVEDRITGAFLSGAGAGFQASLVEKVDPVEIAGVLKTVLQMSDEEEVDLFHPTIALLQTWIDPADPLNYGRLWRERRGPVPHLVMTSGLLDTFTPKRCHGALAGSFGLPLATPIAEPVAVLELEGIAAAGDVLEGNLLSVDGAPLTAGVLQYPNDGHFAVYNNADAQTAMRSFFMTLHDGVPFVRVK